MNLTEYFKLVQTKIKDNDFTILEINAKPPKELSVFIEATNYLMWEWCDDHKDNRTHIFDYIIIPNNVDFDFTSISFKEFLAFLTKVKSTKIETITI